MSEIPEDDVASLLKEIECDIKTALQKHKDSNGGGLYGRIDESGIGQAFSFICNYPDNKINLKRRQ